MNNASANRCAIDGGYEDVEIAKCLRIQGVYPGISLDKYDRELFHPLSFHNLFSGNVPDWMYGYSQNTVRKVSLSIVKLVFISSLRHRITIVVVIVVFHSIICRLRINILWIFYSTELDHRKHSNQDGSRDSIRQSIGQNHIDRLELR